jgi:hypothetical protein
MPSSEFMRAILRLRRPYHRPMPRLPAAAVLLASAALTACSPTFDWREVRIPSTPLQAMLPCKPQSGSRRVQMGPLDVVLEVTGCDTGGATFAILHADVRDPARVGEALANWNKATLATMKAGHSQARPFAPPGATASASAMRVSASGTTAQGAPVRSEAAYFAKGTTVYQAVVFAPDPKPDVLQAFFDGLAFE